MPAPTPAAKVKELLHSACSFADLNQTEASEFAFRAVIRRDRP